MAIITNYSLFNLRRTVNAMLWGTLPVLATLTAVYVPTARALTQLVSLPTSSANRIQPTHLSTAKPTPVSTAQTSTSSTIIPPVTTPTTTVSPTPQTCTPLAFGQPSQLELSGAANGLTTQFDTATYYRIYGYNADQLRSQIQHCAPTSGNGSLAEFTGETNYSLGWSYNYTALADGSCTLSNVKVGIHTGMALPTWETNETTTGLASRWTQFSSALVTHEQGHVAIDKLYAAKLVTDLNALPAIACQQLASTANGMIQADVHALNQANTDYDAQTNHGATQGAILPTR